MIQLEIDSWKLVSLYFCFLAQIKQSLRLSFDWKCRHSGISYILKMLTEYECGDYKNNFMFFLL